ncbi:hypothetical protein AVEN_90636-1 [Araneus ventricosus]|uniref:Uncharacterized protein n=1 Tax=Araneus ventricosus TaxID=182803 RepID=A0A4Y2Q8S6_ARAVE|nr:hypothetical protein AVEN_90636-1 [Araneus ventricosus]
MRFINTNSHQITNNVNNSTFNGAQLTGFLACTADETPKSLQWINTQSPLIQDRPLHTLPDRPWRHMEFSRTFEGIFFPNRDIEKRVAFSGIIYLSPKWSPRSSVPEWPLPVTPCLPL